MFTYVIRSLFITIAEIMFFFHISAVLLNMPLNKNSILINSLYLLHKVIA